jgi:hypothetical protein
MSELLRKIIALFRWSRDEGELEREMAAHLALLEESYRLRGMTAEEAHVAARRAMGSVAFAKDLHRDARSFTWLDDARGDLRFAARMLTRNPGFAVVAIVTMAISIGATTTLFSLAYGVLMRPLPWPEADGIVRLQETRGGRISRIPWTISNATYLAWRDKPSTTEEIGGWFRSRPMTLTSSGEPERLPIGSVTPSLLRVVGAHPVIGGIFLYEDAEPGRTTVLLLGFGVWQRRFGGRTDVIGESVRLDGQAYTVVGVMPKEFAFPSRETEAWTPLGVASVKGDGGVIRLMLFSAMARLKPGVAPAQAAAEATTRCTRGAGSQANSHRLVWQQRPGRRDGGARARCHDRRGPSGADDSAGRRWTAVPRIHGQPGCLAVVARVAKRGRGSPFVRPSVPAPRD